VEELPENAKPDALTRLAVDGFGMTRGHALARADALRQIPLTEDDYVQPGEDVGSRLRELAQTDDYRDYHQLLGINRMLDDLRPLVELITDPDLAAEIRAWLEVQPQLDPVPEIDAAPRTAIADSTECGDAKT
jgi:hypothetical protein